MTIILFEPFSEYGIIKSKFQGHKVKRPSFNIKTSLLVLFVSHFRPFLSIESEVSLIAISAYVIEIQFTVRACYESVHELKLTKCML